MLLNTNVSGIVANLNSLLDEQASLDHLNREVATTNIAP